MFQVIHDCSENGIDDMKHWVVPELGLSKLELRTVPRPRPGPGQVLVKVHAVSLNYRDAEVIEHGMGVPISFPFRPTSDMAGTVTEVGSEVTRFVPGDKVISAFIAGWLDGSPRSGTDAPTQGGPIPGMLAQYVATPAEWCVQAPRSLTLPEACTLPVAGLTAWTALFEMGRLRPGETVVVQGTGGVSLFAIQLASAAGARTIVTSSSAEKLQRAIKLGATHGVNRTIRPDWENPVLELTEGRGADHILEMAGGDNLARSLQAILPGGYIWMIGLLGAEHFAAPILSLLASRASIVGISVGHRRALEDLVRVVDAKSIKPVIDASYSFDRVPEAFAHLRRGAFGKIVVEVAEFES
jgi:NADPH:quinone reductase-like Zn-dependent oxidoreductase